MWDSTNLLNLATLSGFHKRGICLLAFSNSGNMLATVGMDNDHSIAVYDWRTQSLVASGKGDKGKMGDPKAWTPYFDGDCSLCGKQGRQGKPDPPSRSSLRAGEEKKKPCQKGHIIGESAMGIPLDTSRLPPSLEG